jgi:hypothetical protein
MDLVNKFPSMKDSMQLHRFTRHLTFFSIFLVHIGMILIWQGTSPSPNSISNTDKVLLLLPLPQQKQAIEVTQQKNLKQISPTSTIARTNKKNINTPEFSTAKIQTPSPEFEALSAPPSTPSPSSPDIQKNIRELSLSLKDDFLKQEKNYRPDGKSSSENMKKFSNTLAGVVQSQTEGTVIEKKFAYDGRPVSKIKTPFGTHCVRHPKAGEKLELSPPPLPVGCGEL